MSFDLRQVVKGMRIADFPAFESSEISELLPNDWRVKISTLNKLAQCPLLTQSGRSLCSVPERRSIIVINQREDLPERINTTGNSVAKGIRKNEPTGNALATGLAWKLIRHSVCPCHNWRTSDSLWRPTNRADQLSRAP